MKWIVCFLSSCILCSVFGTQVYAKQRACYANFCNSTRIKCSGKKKIGMVRGLKHERCKALAEQRLLSYVRLYVYPKSTSLCGKQLGVYVETTVQGKSGKRTFTKSLSHGSWSCTPKYKCPSRYGLTVKGSGSIKIALCTKYKLQKSLCWAAPGLFANHLGGTLVGGATIKNGRLYKPCYKAIVVKRKAASVSWTIQ